MNNAATRNGAGVGKLPGRASTHPPVLLVPKPEAGKPTPLPHSADAGKQVVLGALKNQLTGARKTETRNIHQVLPVMAWLPSPSS